MRELLNTDLVRRIALPLRTCRPRLYSWLNRRRKRLLSGRDDLDAYQANALHRFAGRAGIGGPVALAARPGIRRVDDSGRCSIATDGESGDPSGP